MIRMYNAQRNVIIPDRRTNSVGAVSGGGLAPMEPADTETLSGLFRVLRRRLGTVIAIAATIIILGTVACFLIIPKYSATTTIEINQDSQGMNSVAQDMSTTPTSDELKPEIQTDVQILRSDDLALEVIHDLSLEDKRPFRSAIYSKERGLPLDRAPRTRERLLHVFANNLKVESPQDTRLIHVTFRNPDASVASAVTEDLANKFIDGTLERRHQSTQQSSYWLQKELGDLKAEVEQSEQKLADYERQTGLAGIQFAEPANATGSGTVSASPHNTVTDRLFALNQELTSAEASRISAETVYRLVRTQDPEVVLGLGAMSVSSSIGGASGAITADGGIQLVRQLRWQEADLTREYSADAVKYGSNNPRLIELQHEIAEVKKQTQAELERISKRAENAYLYAKSNEDSIRKRFEQQQTAANTVADKTVQLQVLAQEAYSNRALYESLFSKLQTATLASGVRATRIDIVDHALPAGTPSSPEYAKYLALIFGFGVFVGISSAFLRESLDNTVRTPRDLDEISSLPMLGYLTRLRSVRSPKRGSWESELIKSPLSPFSEAIRALRTSILHELPPTKGRTLLITSAIGGDGKTTVAYNLGIALAQQGSKVLLVDADIRNPDLHRRFGTALSPGLGDIQSWDENSTLPKVVKHSSLSNLFLLPAGHRPGLPAEFLASPLFGSLLEACERQFDYVLVDSAPMLAVTDASIIAAKTSGTIAVLRSRSTTRARALSLIKALRRTGSPVIGAVLNDVRRPMLDGYYEYGYSRRKGNQLHAG